MKLYRESLRRLSRMGITLLIISVVITVIVSVRQYLGARPMNADYLGHVMTIMPVLPFYVFGAGLGFAFVGFSFLNKRADSDFYHSIPVTRSDLFVSITLASFTWMAGTIFINAMVSALMMVLMGIPFVPAYLPLGMLLFMAAGMLIFAAAAIGCSLTGTPLSNFVMAGLVLFLPRFILFICARGIVASAQIIGWMDLPRWVQPDMNAATGLVAMLSRNMYISRIANMGTILYSFGLGILELVIGWQLFKNRPSEMAEQGAKSRKLQTLFACLLALPVALLGLTPSVPMSEGVKAYFTSYSALIFVAALAVYAVYQIVVLRSTKRVLRSIPWFACTLVATAAVGVCIHTACIFALNQTPDGDQINYVVFEGYDSESSVPSYSTLEVSKIRFEEPGVKNMVADSLKNAAKLALDYNQNGTYGYRTYSDYQTIERVRIVLNNGRTIRRGITFDNINSLNDLRSENQDFVAAIRAMPPDDSVFRRISYFGDEIYTTEDIEKLRVSYNAEVRESGQIVPFYYKPRTASVESKPYTVNEEQSYGDFSIGGYVGTKRYLDAYPVTMATPKTASLLMMLNNRHGDEDNAQRMKNAYEQIAFTNNDNDYFSISMTFSNIAAADGEKRQVNLGYYTNVYELKNNTDRRTDYSALYAAECMKIIQRGKLTTDATAFNLGLTWNAQINGAYVDGTTVNIYYGFSAEDEAALTDIIQQWQAATYSGTEDKSVYAKEAPVFSSSMPESVG